MLSYAELPYASLYQNHRTDSILLPKMNLEIYLFIYFMYMGVFVGTYV